MITFLEYLKEYNRRLKEDAVMSAGDAASSGGDSGIVSPGEVSTPQNLDISSPKNQTALTDYSILGKCSGKKFERDGFLGKNDFHVPVNVLSGDCEPKILKRV